jgi:hypothetical protein
VFLPTEAIQPGQSHRNRITHDEYRFTQQKDLDFVPILGQRIAMQEGEGCLRMKDHRSPARFLPALSWHSPLHFL